MIIKNEFMQVALVCKISWDEKILQTRIYANGIGL